MNLKTDKELNIMREGGKRLREVKLKLLEKVSSGVSAIEIEDLAVSLIKKTGGTPSFMMVPRYNWATCVNVNDGVVHGIPKKETIFAKGDLVSVDVGLYYKGFHTDTSFSKGIDPDSKTKNFLQAGENALGAGIAQVKAGNRVYDISKAIEDSFARDGFVPIKALVGHGIGRTLHEDPYVPCVASGRRENTKELVLGTTLAIEVMYTDGSEDIVTEPDGWTIATTDGKISGLFEDTIALVSEGVVVLT